MVERFARAQVGDVGAGALILAMRAGEATVGGDEPPAPPSVRSAAMRGSTLCADRKARAGIVPAAQGDRS